MSRKSVTRRIKEYYGFAVAPLSVLQTEFDGDAWPDDEAAKLLADWRAERDGVSA
jgi:hypothetical protein